MFSRFAPIVFFLSMLVPQQLSAQGVFRAFGFPKTVTATGQTEVLGSVHLALTLGTTVADTITIDVSPLKITNTSVADIRLTLSGNITTGTVTVEAADGRVRIPLNTGGTSGSIRVDGIRTSLAGTNRSSVTAKLSFGSNYIDGANTVTVADQVQSGLSVDPMTDVFRIFGNTVIKSTATLVLREGFNTAFANSSEFGQDTPTRVRVRVSDFPSGLKMSFPATVTSPDSAATLTTVEGTAIDLPRSNGSTEVTYNFTAAGNSSDVLESFKIPFTVSTTGTVELLQPTIEVSLAPIGADVPTTALPATNVPRYAEENLVALEGTSRIITRTLYWTGIDNAKTNTLSLFNSGTRVANLTLTAFDGAGQTVANVKQSLAANASSNQTLTSIFGTNATSMTTVRVQSTSSKLAALGNVAAAGILESLPLVDRGLPSFVIPYLNEDTRIIVFNPGSTSLNGTLQFRSQTGAILMTASVNLPALGSASRPLGELIGTVSNAGQIIGSFPAGVVAMASFGNANTLNLIAAQSPNQTGAMYVPFFASGAGFETDLDLVNSSNDTVVISAQLIGNDGTPMGTPQSITLVPSAQAVTTLGQLFQLSSFTTGYVRIQVPRDGLGPFISYQAITGFARIRSGQTASTVIPFAVYPMTDASIVNSGTGTGTYQGIALLNPGPSAAVITLQALNNAGTVLGTATVNLAAGQISSKQVSEYFGAAVPEGSVVRVSSTTPVVTTSITGSVSGDTLRSTPGL